MVREIKRLTRAERERAIAVSRNEYPPEMPCAVCGFRWMQHRGTLCPARPGYLVPIDCGDHIEFMPVSPVFGDTTFLPDASYFNQSPDFDVV
jgi:hypothetical protein